MTERFQPPSLWQALTRPDVGVAPRLIASVLTGLLLSACACAGAWGYARALHRPWVRDDDVAAAFAVAGVVWLILLMWIWGGFRRSRKMTRAVVGSLGVVIVVVFLGITIDRAFRGGEDVLIAAVIFLGACGVVLLWAPVIMGWRYAKPVLTPENLVDVACPSCGYSMIGLRSLRCPECGTEYTVDDLIRRQNYGAARPGNGNPPSPPVIAAIPRTLPRMPST